MGVTDRVLGRREHRWQVTASLALTAVLTALVLGSAPAAAPEAGAVGVARFTHRTLTLVDTSRPTQDPVADRDAPTRTLVTEVYVPAGKGPFPLVVMAHGNNGNPGKLSQLLEAWAGAGYVVAAPRFPLTNDVTGPSAPGDVLNQPADMTFVIDQVLRRSRGSGVFLGGRVDPRHIGVGGFSLGGATVYALAFDRCCRDRRIDAVILMDALRLQIGVAPLRIRGPVMFVHLRNDPVVKYGNATESYAEATTPKLLMTLEQGIHPEPYENIPSPEDAAVMAATTRFWDVYLRGEGGIRSIVRAGTDPGLSSVVAKR